MSIMVKVISLVFAAFFVQNEWLYMMPEINVLPRPDPLLHETFVTKTNTLICHLFW